MTMMRRIQQLLPLLLALPLTSYAYITSPGAVPLQRQIKMLKDLTTDICQAPTGHLSHGQLMQSHDLMYAWSHTKRVNKDSALAVESLVKRLIDEQRAGMPVDLDVNDYNCLLEGWARSGQGVAAAERCEQILEQMQEIGPLPNRSSFKAVLMAWRQAAYSADFAPARAQRILMWMIRLVQSEENKQALPDADCFDIVMQIWSRSGHKDGPKQAEMLLGAMEKMYESTGLEKLKPRKTSFNAVLAAWAKHGTPQATDRAVQVLSFMELLASKGDKNVAPDTASYNTVMGAFARSKDQVSAARKADAILRHVEDAYRADPTNKDLVPDTILFNTAMGCWAKTNASGAYRKARSVLDRQKALYKDGCVSCKPDVYGYTSVIGSCAAEPGSADERHKAFNVAVGAYKQLQRSSDGPNHVSYGAMLKACARLLPTASPVRRKWVRQIFSECVESGHVGEMVVGRLREASPVLYKEMMQGYSRKNLPQEWTRNIQNDFRKRSSGQPRKRAEV